VIKLMVKPTKKSGGPGIFMHRLITYMQKYDIVKLVDKQPDVYLSTVWQGKAPKGCKTVYRAASVYYNSCERKRRGLNKKIAAAIRTSDLVIYQTHFARKLCEKVLGKYYNYKVKARKRVIIINGFDKSEYDKVASAKKKRQHRFIACSDWTVAVKRGDVVVRAFCKAKIKDAELIMIGKIVPKEMGIARKHIKSGKIKTLGPRPDSVVMSYLKSEAIFVHLSYVESCPNAVVEALSFGCPVVCNNIGGTPEVVQDSGIIAKCDDEFVFKRRPVDMTIRHFSPIINALQQSIELEGVNREDLSMKRCAQQYKEAFEGIL